MVESLDTAQHGRRVATKQRCDVECPWAKGHVGVGRRAFRGLPTAKAFWATKTVGERGVDAFTKSACAFGSFRGGLVDVYRGVQDEDATAVEEESPCSWEVAARASSLAAAAVELGGEVGAVELVDVGGGGTRRPRRRTRCGRRDGGTPSLAPVDTTLTQDTAATLARGHGVGGNRRQWRRKKEIRGRPLIYQKRGKTYSSFTMLG